MLKKKIKEILSILEKEYRDLSSPLNFNNSFELLIATILSAQCTDKRVNMVTEELFKKYNSVEDFAKISSEELEKEIFSTGFYKQKARNIKNLAIELLEQYDGIVPNEMNKLVKLPGVGRKTASVVLAQAMGIPAFPVDTHVKRLTKLLGLTKSSNPDKIEKEICENLEPENWNKFSLLLILHGRNICVANRPKCEECKINHLCDYFGS